MNETQFTASNDDDIFNSWVASEDERKKKEVPAIEEVTFQPPLELRERGWQPRRVL